MFKELRKSISEFKTRSDSPVFEIRKSAYYECFEMSSKMNLLMHSFVKRVWKFIFSKPKKLTSSHIKAHVSLSCIKTRHGCDFILYFPHRIGNEF